MDHDIQELRRRAAADPDDPESQKALGAVLARISGGWPMALTTNESVLMQTGPDALNLLNATPGGRRQPNLKAMHEDVALEIRNWVEGNGGIPDADLVVNPESYAPAAAHWVLAKLFAFAGDMRLAQMYEMRGWTMLRAVVPKLGNPPEPRPKIVVIPPKGPRYTRRWTGRS